jgi:D-inositol-3-phosphate glycosyltransferase
VRVLLVSANFRPHIGGIERFTETLAGGLAERGHEVEVVCCRFGDAPLRDEADGFAIRRIPSAYTLERRLKVPWPVPEPLRLLRVLRERVAQVDVVHVQDAIYATSAPALAAAKRLAVASVLTQHVAFVPQRSRLLDSVQHGAVATFGRCSRLATVVASMNPAVAAWVERQWRPPDVRVMPVGVGSPHAQIDRNAVRRSFGLPEQRFLALFVGRDVPKKGLDVFVAASDPAYDLIAVTDRSAGKGQARLLPLMSPERLQELLAAVDCFVLPSEGEGFPVTMQEAFTHGLPVVTTRQPGYEQYVSDDEVVFVERDSDAVRTALRRVATDGDLRRRLSASSRKVWEQHFGVERFVSAYEQLYVEARERSSSRVPREPATRPGRHRR